MKQSLMRDLVVSIKASQAINARDDIFDSLVQIAGLYIDAGMTQEGADILAYVLRRHDLPEDVEEQAVNYWDDLARWICPRVLLDAEDFGKKAYFDDVIEYVSAGLQ